MTSLPSSSSSIPMTSLPSTTAAPLSQGTSSSPPAAMLPDSLRHAKKPSMASSMATTSSPVADGFQTPKSSPDDEDDDDDDDDEGRKHAGSTTADSKVSPEAIPAGAIVSPASAATPLATPQPPNAVTASTPAGSLSRSGVPPNAIRLDLLLVTGQRARFDFAPSATLAQVKDRLWQQWPASWPARPSVVGDVRILHLGHILADNVVLGGADAVTDDGLAAGTTSQQASTSSSTATPSAASRLLKKRALNSSSSSSSPAGPGAGGAASLSPRNLTPGTTTVMHVLVKGGFPSETATKGEKGAAGGSRGSKADAKEEGGVAAAGGGRGTAADGNGVGGGDGAGRCRCIVM